MSRLKSALMAAVVLAASAGGIAHAQMDSAFDLDQLPAVHGTVAQYLPTPRGDIDGFMLTDGMEVHVAPHLSAQLVFAIKPGDRVTVHGLKARAVKLFAAASITNDATHVTVAWNGPGPRPDDTALTAQGTVKAPLYGRRGELHGVLLADGTVVRMPPPEAQRLADMLAVGKTLAVRGVGYAGPLGRALDAQALGPDAAHLVPVAAPRPPWGEPFWHGHKGDRHERAMTPPAPPPAQ